MKKTIQLTAIENLISTYYIAPYFNTLLNIPLSLEYLKDCVCGLSYILSSTVLVFITCTSLGT